MDSFAPFLCDAYLAMGWIIVAIDSVVVSLIETFATSAEIYPGLSQKILALRRYSAIRVRTLKNKLLEIFNPLKI